MNCTIFINIKLKTKLSTRHCFLNRQNNCKTERDFFAVVEQALVVASCGVIRLFDCCGFCGWRSVGGERSRGPYPQ